MLFFIIKINYWHILLNSYLKMSQIWSQWRIQARSPWGGGGGGGPPYLWTKLRLKVPKKFLETAPPPPYSQGLDDPPTPWSESVDPATGPGYQIDMFICLYVDVISMMPCLFSVCVIQAYSRQRAWTRCQHRNGAKWWQPNVSPSCRIFGKKMWKIGQMVRAWIIYTVLHVKSRMYLLLLFRPLDSSVTEMLFLSLFILGTLVLPYWSYYHPAETTWSSHARDAREQLRN